MNQASQYLLTLAKKSIQAYIVNPKAKAAMVTGSTATGQADVYSDVEMFIYYDELPDKKELQLARQQNQGSEPILTFDDRSDGHFGEFYFIDGVEFQIGNMTIAFWEQEMAVVLQELDVISPLQKALSGMLECIPVYGEELIKKWQRKISDYPDALAQAMIEKHLNFFPIWAVQERLTVRDTTLFQHQIRLEAGQNLLGVLAGLNRLYYSTFQFKRMKQFIAQMTLAPENLYMRLESIYHQEPLAAANQLKELIAETVNLVELHLPEIDTSKVKRSLERQQHIWKPITEENKLKMLKQKFTDTNTQSWHNLEQLPGTQILPLAEPVPQGSIHRLRIKKGTVIPVHYHPCDEYVYVLEGIIETDGKECKSGTFWFTPANTKNGSHKAITDVELLTIRLGAMGEFET